MSQFTGLALPIRSQPYGYFSVRSALDVAWSDVIQAIFTPVGSQPMNRGYGSGLHLFLFDPSDEYLATAIIQCIREAVNKYTTGVKVENIQVTFNNSPSARVEVKLSMPGIKEGDVRFIDIPLSTRNMYSQGGV